MFSSNLSNWSQGVNTAFIVILSIITFFLVGLTAVLIYFIIRYRESRNSVASQINGNTTLEIVWTAIPLLLVMAMFYYGWIAWKPMESNAPKDAFPIEVTARMWNWSFTYQNGTRLDTLIVPAGKPIALSMKALDVIHSFYIPAFRLKKDINPGTERHAWFIANSPGTYDIFCTEYCGLEHSSMITAVKVLTRKDFDAWYSGLTKTDTSKKEIKTTPGAEGRKIAMRNGCNACHSFDGSKIVGPSFKGIYGEEQAVITAGKEHMQWVDEAYLRRSIIDPNADIVKGFNKGLMLSYKDQISADEITQIIEFIKTLKD
jgi:cytochrome c oxidase subunit II